VSSTCVAHNSRFAPLVASKFVAKFFELSLLPCDDSYDDDLKEISLQVNFELAFHISRF
jgi:hypothetical protein